MKITSKRRRTKEQIIKDKIAAEVKERETAHKLAEYENLQR
jgi:hypothetical protein